MDILLVASPYDSFLLEEAGQLGERMVGEFRNLDLHYGPGLTTVTTGAEALELLAESARFNLVVSGLHLGDQHGLALARQIKDRGLDIPVVLLAFDAREAQAAAAHPDADAVERVFLWQGDAAILLAIVKYIEDRQNLAHDNQIMGVQVILVIEDNVRYYSSFLPMFYSELLRHSRRLISEGVNVSDKIMRMRARPKILLYDTYEDAWEAFVKYQDDVLGVISDIEFPEDGRLSMAAGLRFARSVRRTWPDVPVLLQSSNPAHKSEAAEVDAAFLVKGSPTLLSELRRFMVEYFGFGDFVFRTPDGLVVGRAHDLASLEQGLHQVPAACIVYHAERNHFSSWLKARTEFALASALRPRRLSEFANVEALRRWLIAAISRYRRDRNLQIVADFDPATFRARYDFQRLGGGSLGGKARGLAFVRLLLGRQHDALASDAEVLVPGAVVLATDLFDRFLDDNDLRAFAIHCDDELELEERFAAARFPADVRESLASLLPRFPGPLAVRSSSLLEDSQHQPFAGIYETFMLPMSAPRLEDRLDSLQHAIVRVWASTFSRRAKEYFAATSYRLEEEKMAVILQRVVGAARGPRFYPDLSGVARSHNFYPAPPMTAADGVAAIAMGLGRSVTSDGNCLRFCPRYPHHLLQLSSVREALSSSQRELWVLDLSSAAGGEVRCDLAVAEADGTLAPLASTYSRENDAIYDGTSRPGVRLVTFASVLKHGTFPLAPLLDRLLALGQWGMGMPVELEFACDLAARELAVLQLRPLALVHEAAEVSLEQLHDAELVCRSSNVLGNGRLDELRDVVVVDRRRFDRATSRQTAAALAQLNAELAGRPYILIGVGRWGSSDPWLGIPVTWDQISGARVIVEAGFADFKVTPSQGTHFFQSLTTFHVGYFTVNPDAGEGFVDWDYLAGLPAERELGAVRHLRLERPMTVLMDGRIGQGAILRPPPPPAAAPTTSALPPPEGPRRP